VLDFAQKLIKWFPSAARAMPWRETQDPYLIWISEVILQQTRVAQGLPYYVNFARTYPTVADLAQAPQDDILRIWQGLGYYSRARNMHHTAKEVVAKYNGQFPTSFNELIKLKGIGPYTAAAIASFSSNESVAVVDGNVYRVLARYLDIDLDINSSKGKNAFADAAAQLVPIYNSGTYNQAIMELGSLVCKTGMPECLLCPVNDSCANAYAERAKALPVKIKRLKITTRYLHYFLIKTQEGAFMKVRPSGDVWEGLYEFPVVESLTESLLTFKDDNELTQVAKGLIEQSSMPVRFTHKLTHQLIYINFHTIHKNQISTTLVQFLLQIGFKAYIDEEVELLPKPIVINKFWQEQKS